MSGTRGKKMLQKIRNSSDSIFAKILMGVLVFSFVGWGVAAWVLEGGTRMDDSIVRIGGAPITMQMFEGERSRQLSAMTREDQRAIFTNPALNTALSAQIISNLSAQILLDMRADYLGFAVSNTAIASAIRAEPMFQIDGRFSPDLFDIVLRNNGISEAAFANTVRMQIMRDMVTNSIAAGVHVPNFVGAAMFNARNATRRIEFVRVPFSDFQVAGNPTEEALRQVHAQNPRVVPEARTISYIFVAADMTRPDDIDSAFLRMQQIEDMLIGGSTKAAAARTHNAITNTIRNINREFEYNRFNDVAHRMAFNLEQGIESEIIEVGGGFLIMRVDEIATAHNASFESMERELVGLWRTEEQRRRAYERALEILSGTNQTGDSIARPINVGRTTGAPLPVLSSAFQIPVGTNTIVPTGNEFFVLRVLDRTLPTMTEAQMNSARIDAEQQLRRAIQDDYTAFLSREYPTRVNERMFRRVFGD